MNKIVKYPSNNIYFLSAHKPETLEYVHIDQWKIPRIFSGKFTLESIASMAAELNPLEMEGFVVRDLNTNARITVRSPQYEALSALRQENTLFWKADYNTNEKLMFELVRANSNYEFLNVKCKNKQE